MVDYVSKDTHAPSIFIFCLFIIAATVIFNEMSEMVEVEIYNEVKVKISKKMVYLTVDKTLSPTKGLCGDNDGDGSPEGKFIGLDKPIFCA